MAMQELRKISAFPWRRQRPSHGSSGRRRLCVIKSIVAGGDRRPAVVQLERRAEGNNAGVEGFHPAEPLRTGRTAVKGTEKSPSEVEEEQKQGKQKHTKRWKSSRKVVKRVEARGANSFCPSGAGDANPQSRGASVSQRRPDKTA